MRIELARRVLGVSEDATRREITDAFRGLARRHHPDLGGDAIHFQQAVAARDALLKRKCGDGGGTKSPIIVIHHRPWWRELSEKVVARLRREQRPPRVV